MLCFILISISSSLISFNITSSNDYSKFFYLNNLNNLPVTHVSSHTIISDSYNALYDFIDKSYKFPNGVGHIYKFPYKKDFQSKLIISGISSNFYIL